jgi:hypothetical protein
MRDLPPTPQAKFKMSELARAVIADLNAGKPLSDRQRSPDEIRRDALARLDELQATRDQPITLSPRTRKAMGLQLTDEEEAFLREALR